MKNSADVGNLMINCQRDRMKKKGKSKDDLTATQRKRETKGDSNALQSVKNEVRVKDIAEMRRRM